MNVREMRERLLEADAIVNEVYEAMDNGMLRHAGDGSIDGLWGNGWESRYELDRARRRLRRAQRELWKVDDPRLPELKPLPLIRTKRSAA